MDIYQVTRKVLERMDLWGYRSIQPFGSTLGVSNDGARELGYVRSRAPAWGKMVPSLGQRLLSTLAHPSIQAYALLTLELVQVPYIMSTRNHRLLISCDEPRIPSTSYSPERLSKANWFVNPFEISTFICYYARSLIALQWSRFLEVPQLDFSRHQARFLLAPLSFRIYTRVVSAARVGGIVRQGCERDTLPAP